MRMSQYWQNVVTPEMDHGVIESPGFMSTTRIVDMISTVIIGCILCHYLYVITTFHRYRSAQLKTSTSTTRFLYSTVDKWTTTLNLLSILFILSQFILLLLMSLNIWQVFIPASTSCDSIVICIVTLYHLSKSIFYCILITRLQVAFYLSALRYSNLTVVLLYGFVIVYTVFVCIGTPFLIFGVWIVSPVIWCHIHTHETLLASICIAIWILMDVVISIVLMYMFICPIKKVLNRNDDQKPTRFTALYIKYALLTYISIILNLVSLLVYLFDHLTILIEITAAINCLCIVLMHTRYQSVFRCFCGCVATYFINKQNEKQHHTKEGMVEDATNNNETMQLTGTHDLKHSHHIHIGPDGTAVGAMQVGQDSDDDQIDSNELD
eukprot:21415_1